ncbi:MAG: amino acid adenylation domain-containing protein, partial [Cyanobacteria bacterium P01_H01_bin.121]
VGGSEANQPSSDAAHIFNFDSQRGAAFDLTLTMIQTGQELVANWRYNSDLFNPDTIARMAGHFQTLLQSIVTDPHQTISSLSWLPAAETHQLLHVWNQTQIEYDVKDVCLHQLFEAQVERTPDAIAVVLDDQHLTYRALNQRATQLAVELQTRGVGPEQLVGLCLDRSLDMLVALLGILKAGGAYVPLDPSYPQSRLQFILKDAAVSLVVTQPQFADWLAQQTVDQLYIGDQLSVDPQTPGSYVTKSLVQPSLQPDNLAYVLYTSGSTGHPKGTQISHRGLVNYLYWCSQRYQVAQGTGAPVHSPLGFDATLTSLFAPLIVGQKVVLVLPAIAPSTPTAAAGVAELEALADLLRCRHDFSLVKLTPAHLQMLNQAFTAATQAGQAHYLILGGEELPASSCAAWLEAAPDTHLINEYGPTETVVGCCVHQVTADDIAHGKIPIGRPIANTQLYILDRDLQPVAIGVPGELYIAGLGLARGYWNHPELTAEKFIPNPFRTQGVGNRKQETGNRKQETGNREKKTQNSEFRIPFSRLYKTGDLARYQADGTIEFLGRIDHQVKIRGFRIELGEVEGQLNQLPMVEASIVMLREDEHPYIAAYVVLQPGSTATVSQMQELLKEWLPSYMIPGSWAILEEFPLTPNGKVDRRALAALEAIKPVYGDTPAGPLTPIEEMLVGIWAQVLGVDQVGVWDNFFELGGHSLLVTQVMSRVRQNLAIDLPLRYLFEFPTVAELAKMVQRAIDQATAPFVPPITPVKRTHQYPLSFAQERLWFLEQLQPGIFAHNIPAAVRLTGSLDVAAVELSLNEIVQRHEVLRVTFQVIDGHPMQVLDPTVHVVVPVVDLQALAPPVQMATVQGLVHAEVRCPFDLTQGPLLRCTLLKLAETEHIALFTMHHIVSDGWSMGVLIRELAVFYQGFAARRPTSLPPLPIQYADFTLWQRQWLQGEDLESHLDYWRRQLAGSNSLQLPTDYSPSGISSYRGKTHTWQLSPELSQALIGLSRQAGVTLFMTLMAAFKILLHRQNQQTDIVVGTDIANRNRAEVEQLIGFFVNLVVLRTSLAGNPTFQELLRRVFEVSMAAYAHQDVPFSKLVEALQPDRHSSATPLFQILFVMQNNPVTTVEFSELTLSPIATDNETVKFDVVLFVTETENGIVGSWRYNADLFAANTIARLSEQFKTLLEDVVRQPEARIDALNILSEAEKQQQLALAAQKTQKKRKKFMRVQPKTVTLPQKALIKTGFSPSQPELPLVLEPDHAGVNLIDWAQ